MLIFIVLSVYSSQITRDYKYNKYPNQRFVYTLGPNIYAAMFLVISCWITSLIFFVADWRRCCSHTVDDDKQEEIIEEEYRAEVETAKRRISMPLPELKGDINNYI